jgi:uncharacterized OB-fold protein
MAEDGDLTRRILAYAGRPARPAYSARHPISMAMIQQWADALGDNNAAYAEVAPAAMLTVWTMPGLDPSPPTEGPLDELVELMLGNGFSGVIATNLNQEFIRPLKPGELVTVVPRIDAVVGPKRTALGTGFFLDIRQDVTVSGEAVGSSTMRILRYRPASTTPATGSRPRPVMDPDTSFFWAGVDAGELRIQRCVRCKVLRHPPRPMCSSCNSLDWDWIVSSGHGIVYSYVVHHAPPMPGMAGPFVVALIELQEGTRLVSNIIEVDPSTVFIGMEVEVVVERVQPDLTLPLFRPAAGGATKAG